MGKSQPDYSEVHKHDLARADFTDVFGGPLRNGCFKLLIAGGIDLAALKRVREHIDLTIQFFEDDEEATRASQSPPADATREPSDGLR